MEEKIIGRLLEIDQKAQEIETKRVEGLKKLEEDYRKRTGEIIEKYEKDIEETARKAFNDIVESGKREAEEIKKDANNILRSMEERFLNVKDEIEREFFLRIFKVKR